MQLHAATGFSYDPEIFDEAFIDALMSDSDPEPDDFSAFDAIPEDAPVMLSTGPERPLDPDEIRALMEETWEELYQSEEGALIRSLPQEDRERLKADFMSPPDPISPDAAAQLVPPGDRVTFSEEEDGEFRLMQGDSVLLSGPLGTTKKHKQGQFKLAAAMCIADIIAMVIAAVGVLQALNNKTIAKAGAKICTSCGGKIVKSSGTFAKAVKRGSDLSKAKHMMGVAKSVIGGYGKMAGYLLMDMGKLEKAAALTTAVGGIMLALASGSTSLWVTVMAMAAALAMFLADTAVAIKKYKEWQAA